MMKSTLCVFDLEDYKLFMPGKITFFIALHRVTCTMYMFEKPFRKLGFWEKFGMSAIFERPEKCKKNEKL